MTQYHAVLRFRVLSTLLCASFAAITQAQTFPIYKNIHGFGGTITCANGKTGPDGTASTASITFDSFGNMFGTTSQGGYYSQGIVWEITRAGVYKDLHDFGGTVTLANGKQGSDGAQPAWQVTFDRAGNMFGTTYLGGPNGNANNSGGNLWEITKSGAYKDLHDFGGTYLSNGVQATDGSGPESGVTFDSAGNMFGTTWSGGSNNSNGMLWELTKSGSYKDLHNFGGTVTNADGTQGPDGVNPDGPIAFDAEGNILGLTYFGGPNLTQGSGSGIIWKLTKAGNYKDLHDFGGTVTSSTGESIVDGIEPNSGATLDSEGNIYGTATYGGQYVWQQGTNAGMVWELTKSGHYKDLHDFGGQTTNSNGETGVDGIAPMSSVVIDRDGNLFGTTAYGGEYDELPTQLGNGIVWEITKGGAYKDLYDFFTVMSPYAGVTFDDDGNMFGTTASGNSAVTGNVWELCRSANIETLITDAASSTVLAGSSYTGIVNLNGTAIAGETVTLTSKSASLKVPATVTIAAGQNMATFPITTSAVTHPESARITAKLGSSSATLNLTVAPLSVSSVSISPTSTQGSSTTSVVGTVTLSGPAPSAGVIVTLSSSDPAAASVPKTVTVGSGLTSATFAVKLSSVSAAKTVKIKATYGGVTTMATLKVMP